MLCRFIIFDADEDDDEVDDNDNDVAVVRCVDDMGDVHAFTAGIVVLVILRKEAAERE